jgi:alkyldihydroxyacetonephosphate synthase
MRTRRFWGWGYEDEGPDPRALAAIEAGLPAMLGMREIVVRPRPRIDEIELRAPRVTPPATLARLCDSETLCRASHSYGKSYRDLVRAYARDFSNPPDIVAFPESEQDVAALLDWCGSNAVAAIPFGGGSSVCGGVEPQSDGPHRAVVSLDLAKLGAVLEVDRTSRAARIQAGVLGPALEEALRPHGLTLRHYPQSFEFSSLGGWIATRSGGHFATGPTHIDDLVESLRVVTPRGLVETRRLPGDGAGPSPERLFIGSEGILGVISEAWMRLYERPRFRAKANVVFSSFAAGANAVRALAQSGLAPSNCRLLDPLEAMLNGAGNGSDAVLLVGFESSDHALDAWIRRAAELCRDAGGTVPEEALVTREDDAASREGSAGAWRDAFLRAPYLRDELVARGVFVETFETAVTWDRFAELHQAVIASAQEAARDRGGAALTTCRITHAYPDGAAPYFTVIAPARAGAELGQWQAIKEAVTSAMLAHGGTVTHHHAVGRDFRPWYERQVPPLYREALRAAKLALDPAGTLNPGVLLDLPH